VLTGQLIYCRVLQTAAVQGGFVVGGSALAAAGPIFVIPIADDCDKLRGCSLKAFLPAGNITRGIGVRHDLP